MYDDPNLLSWIRRFFVAYLIFVIFGSLVPLAPKYIPFDVALARFADIPFLELGIGSRADWVANLLLFVPLAFFAGAVVARGGRIGLAAMALVTMFGAVFSLALEFTQLYFPQRTVSQNDIMAETLGAALGVVGYRLMGPVVLDHWRGFFREGTSAGRLRKLLVAYLLGLLAFSVLPLDLTFDLGVLHDKWKRGGVVLLPFSRLGDGPVEAIYNAATEMAIWVPVAWLMMREGLAPRSVVLRTLAAAVAIEAVQFFVYTRTTDITDVMFAGLSAWLTVSIGPCLNSGVQARLRRWALPLVGLWSLALLTIFWWPFNFDPGLLGVARIDEVADRTLFETYYYGTEFRAVNEVLRKVLFFAPVGVLWVLGGGRRVGGAIIGALLAMLVETGQLALPDKFPDVTDALLEWAGVLGGMWITRRVLEVSDGRPAPAQVSEPVPAAHPQMPGAGAQPETTAVPRRIGWAWVVASGAILAVALWALAALPGVPYNVRELLGSEAPFAAPAIALWLWSLSGGALFLADAASRRAGLRTALPVVLTLHGAAVFLILQGAVPTESLNDILGSPVLGWPAGVEHGVRFLAFNGLLGFCAVLAASLCLTFLASRARALGTTLMLVMHALWIIPVLHWAVVGQAATDNLTELLRGNGAFLSWLALVGALCATWIGGGALTAAIMSRVCRRRALLVWPFAMVSAVTCAHLALEPIIVKYGKVFSAWQFLLSADRDHYLDGFGLGMRGAALLLMLVLGVMLMLLPVWRVVSERWGGGVRPLRRHHA